MRCARQLTGLDGPTAVRDSAYLPPPARHPRLPATAGCSPSLSRPLADLPLVGGAASRVVPVAPQWSLVGGALGAGSGAVGAAPGGAARGTAPGPPRAKTLPRSSPTRALR